MTPRDKEIFDIIKAAAEAGAPFPQDLEIARLRGFTRRGGTAKGIKRLTDNGHITITRVNRHRQAHIGPHSTAPYAGKGSAGRELKAIEGLKPTGKFGADTCRYLYGEPKDHNWCGHKTMNSGASYCETHYILCHDFRRKKEAA